MLWPLGLLRRGRALWGKGQEPGWPQRVLPRALQVLQLRPDPPFPPPGSAPVAVLLAGWVPQGSWAVTKDTAGHAWLRALGEQAPSPPSSGLSPHPPSLNTLISLALSASAQPSLPPPHPAQCPGQEGSWGSSGNCPQSAESRREPAHPCWGRGAGGLGGQPGLLSPRPPGRVSCRRGCGQHRTFASPGLSFPSCSRGSGEVPARGVAVTAEEVAGP